MKVAERARTHVGSATFWVIALVPVVVFLTTPRIVLQDGGLHLANAVAWRGLIENWFPSLLSWRAILPPNLTVEVVLAGLTTIVSADTALRLVIVIGLLGYALAVAALIRAAGLPAYMGIPLLAFEMHYFVMLGFLGFVWAVPLALGAIAVVIRQPLNPPRVSLTLLLIATWFTHIVPALAATIATTTIVVVAHLANREQPRQVSATLKVLAVPIATMALLTLIWFLQSRTTDQDDLYQQQNVFSTTKDLLQFWSPLVAYAYAEKWLARTLAIAIYAVAAIVVVIRVRDRRYLDRLDGILASAAVMAVLAVVLPAHTNSGAGYVGVRMSLFAALFLILWVCTQLSSLQGRVRTAGWGMLAVAAIVAVTIPIVRIPALHHFSAQIEQIEELAACLPLHSTVIQVTLDDGRSTWSARMGPTVQTGEIAVPREALDLGNESGWHPHYIWRFTDIARADRYVTPGGRYDDVPTPIKLGSAMAGGLPLTAVVVYGRRVAPESVLSEPAVRTLDQDLSERFYLVTASAEGNAELWLRKDVLPSC